MPFYDFCCEECEILIEDEFFKIADEKIVKCDECGKRMKQVILKAPGLSDPRGIGQKWTNDGYQMVDDRNGQRAARMVKNKWVKGKQVITADIHKDFNPVPPMEKIKQERIKLGDGRFIKGHKDYKLSNPPKPDPLETAILDKIKKTKKTGV